MTATVGSEVGLAEEWLSIGARPGAQPRELPKTYPKRSELRRAEARAGNRKTADRRPAGGRPPGSPAKRSGPPAPAASARSAEAGRRPNLQQPRLPLAVSPTPAVLPIRQTSNWSRPAGIDVPVPPVPPSQDAFHQPAPLFAPMVPIAVPAPPMAPRELAAPVAPALDPAAWGLEIDAAPATGRRRGASDSEADRRRKGPDSSVPLPARLLGRGKAGAARLLVLALVVGAEGVAVTAMGGHHAAPVQTGGADASAAGNPASSSAFELSADLSQEPAITEAVQREQAAQVADSAAQLALTRAQSDASHANKAKVVAALQQAKAAADRVKAAAERRARAMRNAQRDPKSVARIMAAERGWNSAQFSCLVSLWNRESTWNYQATNSSSGAYGIAQALPGSKMASAGADWRTNPVTQIRWGLEYISGRYGTPCGAWAHSESTGWY